jgi:hypothetical protein
MRLHRNRGEGERWFLARPHDAAWHITASHGRLTETSLAPDGVSSCASTGSGPRCPSWCRPGSLPTGSEGDSEPQAGVGSLSHRLLALERDHPNSDAVDSALCSRRTGGSTVGQQMPLREGLRPAHARPTRRSHRRLKTHDHAVLCLWGDSSGCAGIAIQELGPKGREVD